jgi:hypothetical protein
MARLRSGLIGTDLWHRISRFPSHALGELKIKAFCCIRVQLRPSVPLRQRYREMLITFTIDIYTHTLLSVFARFARDNGSVVPPGLAGLSSINAVAFKEAHH